MIKTIQKNMNKKGFTLVELIIVIAVMAILAAIVVPRMSGITNSFKVRAAERTCATIAREIEVRIQNGSIDDSSNITLTNVSGVVSDAGTSPIGGAYQYSYNASNDTLTVTVTGPTISTPALENIVVTNVKAIVE